MIKIYGIKEQLNPIKAQLSDAINQCMVDALSFPKNKRAHRFFPTVTTISRWWWPDPKGEIYPPPDIGRSFTWFAPRATGRWRAFFLILEGHGTLPPHTTGKTRNRHPFSIPDWNGVTKVFWVLLPIFIEPSLVYPEDLSSGV